MFICRNSEGIHANLLKSYRGACSSVGLLKGTWSEKDWGTPVLEFVI